MEEKVSYKGLLKNLETVFGKEFLTKKSRKYIQMTWVLDEKLKHKKPDEITLEEVQRMKELLDGDHDPTFHMSSH